jgi:hypothetical protein
LADYANYLKIRQQHEGGQIIKIVLSLRKVEDAVSANKLKDYGFVNVNYTEFFEEIKRNIGFYLNHAHPEYLFHLKDLIKSIENLSANMNTDSPVFKFFAQHEDELLNLMDVYQEESAHLANCITKLRGLITEEFFQTLKYPVYQSTWKKTTLYHDINLPDGKIVSVEATLRFKGWFLNIFVRNIKKGEKQEVLLQTLKLFENNPATQLEGTNPQKSILGKFPIETSVDVIAEKMKEAMRLTEPRQEISA